MAKNLTDVAGFPTIVVPEDGDARNAASVETPFQQLANRTANSNSRLNAYDDVLNSFASFALSGATSPASNVTLAVSSDPGAVYSVAGNEITVGSTGWYLATAQVAARTDDASDPAYLAVEIQKNASVVTNIEGRRYSATVGSDVYMHATAMFEVTDVAHTIRVRNTSVDTVTVTAGSRLFIQRLS